MKTYSSLRNTLSAALTIGALSIASTAMAAPACSSKAIDDVSQSGVRGVATVCSVSEGIASSITIQGLIPGNAYTSWFIYFDNPAACTTPYQCFFADLIGPNPADPVGVIGRMDGVVADRSGYASFQGRIRSFRPSSGSQVHVVIFNHGHYAAGDTKALARQLLTPETPALGAPGMGVGSQNAMPLGGSYFTMP